MRVLIAPDGFGGSLTAREVADAVAHGWAAVHADDELMRLPMSDGGEGLLEVVEPVLPGVANFEVAGPLGRPVVAGVRLDENVAVVESAQACGLALVPRDERDPRRTTTYGVGQLIGAVRRTGVKRIVVGLGGSSTVDGGAGALSGLGFRLIDDEGGGLKIGGGHLDRVHSASRGWSEPFDDVGVELLADVTTRLEDAPAVFGPQKGADEATIRVLESGLQRWADVAERDLADGARLRELPGSGSAGGLAFGLACGIDARIVRGFDAVASMVGLDTEIERTDIVVTGEGRLDRTSAEGKVVGEVVRRATRAGISAVAVVGGVREGAASAVGLEDVEAASPEGPGADPFDDVRRAARRLAERVAR